MNKENKKRMRIMEELRLPELQARFHDIVGEATRSPTKKFLLRRIAEALETQEQEATADGLVTTGGSIATPRSVEKLPRRSASSRNHGRAVSSGNGD